MITLFSIVLLVVGLTILSLSARRPGSARWEFPRHREPVAPSRRILSVLLGIVIAVCGGGILVVSHLGKTGTAP